MTAPADPAPTPPLRDVLRDRSVISFLVAVFSVSTAVNAQVTALGKQVFDITHRELDLGLLGLAEFLPAIVLVIVAGSVADRFDRRRVTAAAYVGEAMCAVALAVVAAHGVHTVTPIFALVVVFGIARAFAAPSIRALPVNIVRPEAFPRLIAMNAAMWQAGMIVGPVLAGFFYLVSPAAPYVATAVLCAIGAAAMGLIEVLPARRVAEPVDPANAASPHGRSPDGAGRLSAPARQHGAIHEAFEGLRAIRRLPILLGAISLDLFAVLFGGAFALLPALAEERLHVGAAGFGWLRAAAGLGAALTTVVIATRPLRRHVGPVLLTAVGIFGAFTIVLGATRSYALAFAALVILGGADAVSVFIRGTIAPLVTPDALRGRVMAVESVFIGASNELGMFESGVVGQLIGASGAVVFGGVATIVVVGLWAAFFPGLRSVDRFSDL